MSGNDDRWTLVACALAALLFATTLTTFRAGVVDTGAWRVVGGDVPYRDFWTMYAPGSFYVVAGAFGVFGREMFVSNLLGLLTATAGVGVFHRLSARLVGGSLGLLPSALFAAAYFGSGYHAGFASYPPAILLILLGSSFLIRFTEDGGWRALVAAGICFGLTAIFKHDLGAYACVAAAAVLALHGAPGASRLRAILVLACVVLVVMAPVVLPLAFVAGPEMAQDLVVFPLTDFPAAREERFPPLVPVWEGDSVVERVRRALRWAGCNWPLFLALAALPALWRRRSGLDRGARTLLLFAALSFPLFWYAAHVQLNTHLITLTALAALLGAAAFLVPTPAAGRRGAALALCLVWCAALAAESGYRVVDRVRAGTEWVGLPHLTLIRAPRQEASRLRGLARAIEDAAPPGVPLQLVANRNDVHLYAEGLPFWLSDRPVATRHHELHPAVTDTEGVQRRMLAEIAGEGLPVIVRERRFPRGSLDGVLGRFRELGLPVGSGLLDEWLERNYAPGARYGMYEVLEAR